ncbi:tetratricopeptide repeat-containing sulfotransferase family protein [Marinicella sp. W31]|uniref:tetratricopeptide repeat-containing sulfotransferase family protein n=1 Tax=Marinicella sp. W31 TaxID=3023713 RepID=UPI0037566DB5
MIDQLLQQASQSLQTSDFHQALHLSQQALNISAQHPHALFIKAIALGNTGQLADSIKIMEGLTTAHPNNPEMFYNTGLIYQVNEEHLDAIEQYKKCLRLQPQHLMALNNLALQFQETGHFKDAITHFKRALDLAPNNSGMVFNLAHALHQDQQCQASLQLLKPLLASHPSIEVIVLSLKNHLALGDYQSAYDLTMEWTEHSVSYFYMGLAAIKMFKYPIAITALKTYYEKSPDDIAGQMNLALAYAYSNQIEQAEQLMDQLLSRDKTNTDIIMFCARLYDMRNMKDCSLKYIHKGLQLDPHQAYLQTLKASLARKSRDYDLALQLIEQVITQAQNPQEHSAALFEKGKTLDALGLFDKAWPVFVQANQISHREEESPFLHMLESERKAMQAHKYDLNPLKKSQAIQQVFVMGFPRSGTTLIDSILNSYENTLVLEEIPILDHLSDQLFSQYSNDINRIDILSQLDEDTKSYWHDQYFKQLGDYIDWHDDNILINKSPLNIIHLPLIHALFPKQPILLGLRHPIDSVFSCFIQDFQSHALLGGAFSSLPSITRAYDVLLSYWKQCQDSLDIQTIPIKYENMINDFENETRRLIQACKFDWKEDLDKFYQANNRSIIQNPSSDQVNQPIYSSSVYRHKNYSAQLQEVKDQLHSWIAFFNYS